MVKEDNIHYYNANKYIMNFLSTHCSPEIVDQWKQKANLHKFKNQMKPNKQQFPLRPKSEYIYFCKEFRPQIQEEMLLEKMKQLGLTEPNDSIVINIHEVTCRLGQKWQAFKASPDAEIQQKLAQYAEDDNKRYYDEKKAIEPKKKDENKHLRSKYLFYCREQRLVNPGIKMKILGEQWAQNKNDPELTQRYETAVSKITKSV